jgi:hypothetical protein
MQSDANYDIIETYAVIDSRETTCRNSVAGKASNFALATRRRLGGLTESSSVQRPEEDEEH